VSNATIRRSVVGSLVIVALTVTVWSAVAQAGPTPTPTSTPTPTAPPPFTPLINGDFETGDLTGWTLFTTFNGTIGSDSLPHVVSFDTNNDGLATESARFRVGKVVSGVGDGEGGGLFQQVELSSGDLTIEADIASFNISGANGSGGYFELLLDGVVVDVHDFGFIERDTTEYSMLSSLSAITAGTHEIRIRMTRPAVSR